MLDSATPLLSSKEVALIAEFPNNEEVLDTGYVL